MSGTFIVICYPYWVSTQVSIGSCYQSPVEVILVSTCSVSRLTFGQCKTQNLVWNRLNWHRGKYLPPMLQQVLIFAPVITIWRSLDHGYRLNDARVSDFSLFPGAFGWCSICFACLFIVVFFFRTLFFLHVNETFLGQRYRKITRRCCLENIHNFFTLHKLIPFFQFSNYKSSFCGKLWTKRNYGRGQSITSDRSKKGEKERRVIWGDTKTKKIFIGSLLDWLPGDFREVKLQINICVLKLLNLLSKVLRSFRLWRSKFVVV